MIKRTEKGWSVDIQPGGRSGKRFKKTFKTKAEALRWEAHVAAREVHEPWNKAPSDSRRLKDLVAFWFEHYGHGIWTGPERRRPSSTSFRTSGTRLHGTLPVPALLLIVPPASSRRPATTTSSHTSDDSDLTGGYVAVPTASRSTVPALLPCFPRCREASRSAPSPRTALSCLATHVRQSLHARRWRSLGPVTNPGAFDHRRYATLRALRARAPGSGAYSEPARENLLTIG